MNLKIVGFCFAAFILMVTRTFSQKGGLQNSNYDSSFSEFHRRLDKRVKLFTFKGILVGTKRASGEHYFFKFSPSLTANASMVQNNEHDPLICDLDSKSIDREQFCKVTITFPKRVVDKIRKREPSQLFIEITLVDSSNSLADQVGSAKGIFSITNIQYGNERPQSTFELNPGFEVTEPAEFSIMLIALEVRSYLHPELPGEKAMTKTNLAITPPYAPHEMDSLAVRLSRGIGANDLWQLGKAMSIYDYCRKQVDSASFLNQEGAEVIQKLNEVTNALRADSAAIIPGSFQGVRSGTLDSLRAERQRLLNVVRVYRNTINDLNEVKERVSALVKRNFLLFDQ